MSSVACASLEPCYWPSHSFNRYFLVSTRSPLDTAGPVPAPATVPVPGLPPEATSPDAPPTMPVSVPFLASTSVAVLGGTTGSLRDDVGGDEAAGGAAGGGG